MAHCDPVAGVDCESVVGLQLTVRTECGCIACGPEPLGGAPGASLRGRDVERETAARGAGIHADCPARSPLLVLAVLVRNERAHLAFDGEGAGGVLRLALALPEAFSPVVSRSRFSGCPCAMSILSGGRDLQPRRPPAPIAPGKAPRPPPDNWSYRESISGPFSADSEA